MDIQGWMVWLLQAIMGWGWVSYGFAVVFFTLFVKLMLSPLDFLNRFLTRRTQLRQRAVMEEVADLQRTYADDPMAFARARQQLYQKRGVGGLGSTLVSLVTMILTLVVFFQVLGGFNTVSHDKVYQQYQELNTVYQEYKDGDQDVLKAQLNTTYQKTQTTFGWVKNIWQPDTPWSSPKMSVNDYNSTQSGDRKLTTDEQKADYNAMYELIDVQNSGNGWLLLPLLVAAASGLTAFLNLKINARRNPQTTPPAAAEPVISYSLRDARTQGNNNAQTPAVDPAQMGKMMMWIMPVILLVFGVMQSSAFAIYMIASSVFSTLLSWLFGWVIDLMLRHSKQPVVKGPDFDATVINPHAKYFKGGKK